jgi:DNA mismatch repair protein MutS2
MPAIRVHVPALRRDGEVVRIFDSGVVEVRVGNMTVEAQAEELRARPAAAQSRGAARCISGCRRASRWAAEEEIDLRGMTVDEAIADLSKYLDDAMLAGVSHVRIIHGKGTGVLREGVHGYLRKHRYVSGFSLAEIGEGGSGATEVRL